jgi:hypothetical protein
MQNEEEHLPSADGVVFLSGELGTVPVFAATAMALDGKDLVLRCPKRSTMLRLAPSGPPRPPYLL